MKNEQELKLCPFCGAVGEIWDFNNQGKNVKIVCSNKECKINTEPFKSREYAIRAWNTRFDKTPEELQALVTAEQEGRLVVLLSQNEYTKRLEKLCAENWKVNSLVRDCGKLPEHLEDKALKLMGLKKIVGYANDETQNKIDSQK